MSGETGLHRGHRQRLRQQFLDHGLDPLADVNALELLLFYAIPRQDTNPIAHRLMDTFGSLSAVFDASLQDLMDLGGLTENAAALIKLTTGLGRRYEIRRQSLEAILDTTWKCGDYLLPYFYGATREEVYALALDSKCRVLGCARLFSGSLSAAALSVRSVVAYALRMNAATVVLAHNHTSGVAVPSQEDISTTWTVARALAMVEVLLADHIVVADGDYVSMAESGQMPTLPELAKALENDWNQKAETP